MSKLDELKDKIGDVAEDVKNKIKAEVENFKETVRKDDSLAIYGAVSIVVFIVVCVGLSIITGGALANTMLYGALTVMSGLYFSQITRTIYDHAGEEKWSPWKALNPLIWGRESVTRFWIPFLVAFVLAIIGLITVV